MSTVAASGSVTYRGDLLALVNEFKKPQAGDFIADLVMPVVPVDSKADFLWRWKKGNSNRARTGERASDGSYQRSQYDLGQDTYACVERGFEGKVPFDKSREYAKQFDLERTVAENKLNELRVAREIRVAAKLFNAADLPASGNTGLSVSTKWDVTASALVVDDVNFGKAAVEREWGVTPDTLVIAPYGFRALCMNKQVRESVGLRYSPGAQTMAEVNTAALAEALGLRRVIVGGVKKNTAPDGGAASFSNIWDEDYAALVVTGDGEMADTPSFGRTFAWREDGDVLTMESYEEPGTRSTIVRVRQTVDEKRLDLVAFLFHDIKT